MNDSYHDPSDPGPINQPAASGGRRRNPDPHEIERLALRMLADLRAEHPQPCYYGAHADDECPAANAAPVGNLDDLESTPDDECSRCPQTATTRRDGLAYCDAHRPKTRPRSAPPSTPI